MFSASAPCQNNYVGGVKLILSSTPTGTLVSSISKEHFQMVLVEVQSGQHRLNILALYRSPSQSLADFRHCIDTFVQPEVSRNTIPTVIVADFNVDAEQTSALPGMTQQVTSSTHVDGGILDHVYWTGDVERLSTHVISFHWSDHNIVGVTLSSDQSPPIDTQQKCVPVVPASFPKPARTRKPAPPPVAPIRKPVPAKQRKPPAPTSSKPVRIRTSPPPAPVPGPSTSSTTSPPA